MSKALFVLATLIVLIGACVNIIDHTSMIPPRIAGIGAMAMNSYYLLATACYAAAIAAELIWPSKR